MIPGKGFFLVMMIRNLSGTRSRLRPRPPHPLVPRRTHHRGEPRPGLPTRPHRGPPPDRMGLPAPPQRRPPMDQPTWPHLHHQNQQKAPVSPVSGKPGTRPANRQPSIRHCADTPAPCVAQSPGAGVAESVDASGLGPGGRKPVGVRVSPPAPLLGMGSAVHSFFTFSSVSPFGDVSRTSGSSTMTSPWSFGWPPARRRRSSATSVVSGELTTLPEISGSATPSNAVK